MKTKILLISVGFLCAIFLLSCQKTDDYAPTVAILKSGSITNSGASVFWGHQKFTRETGEPFVVKMLIGSENLNYFEPTFTIHIINGNGNKNLVSSAEIKIDGKLVFGPSDFSQKISYLSKDISDITTTSEIEVLINGIPGSYLDIRIEGDLKEGTSFIDEGGGLLTSEDDSLKILFPLNSLGEGTFLSVIEVTEYAEPENFYGQFKSPVYFLQPGGISFYEPVEVTLIFNPALFANINNIKILHWNPDNDPEIIVPEIDLIDNELTFTISHFSYLAVYESGNYFMVDNAVHPLNLGYNVWFSELDIGNKDIYAHGLYLTSNITITRYNTSDGGKALVPYGKGDILIFNLFSKNNTLTPGKYVFVDDVDGWGNVTVGDSTFTMNSTDKFVTAVKSMNDPTCYGLNVDLDIDWSTVDFNNPSTEVLTKYYNYINSRIGIKEGSVTVGINGSTFNISINCIDINDKKITGSYTGQLTSVYFPI